VKKDPHAEPRSSQKSFIEYSDDQPRVAAGDPQGGQWTSGGGGGSAGGEFAGGGGATATTGALDVVREEEKGIVNSKFEHALIVDATTGEVVTRKTSSASNYVLFTISDIIRMQDIGGGVLFSHNHPSGNSFSPDDLLFAIKVNMKEMRAVTKDFVYRMRPGPAGWPSRKNLNSVYEQLNTTQTAEWGKRIQEKTLSIAEANKTHFHELWKKMVADPEMHDHLIYTWEPRNA
jgi:hypothetical protein